MRVQLPVIVLAFCFTQAGFAARRPGVGRSGGSRVVAPKPTASQAPMHTCKYSTFRKLDWIFSNDLFFFFFARWRFELSHLPWQVFGRRDEESRSNRTYGRNDWKLRVSLRGGVQYVATIPWGEPRKQCSTTLINRAVKVVGTATNSPSRELTLLDEFVTETVGIAGRGNVSP